MKIPKIGKTELDPFLFAVVCFNISILRYVCVQQKQKDLMSRQQLLNVVVFQATTRNSSRKLKCVNNNYNLGRESKKNIDLFHSIISIVHAYCNHCTCT